MIIPNNVNFEEYMQLMGQVEASEIRQASEFEDLLVDRAVNGEGLRGIPLPWSKTHSLFRLRGGEVTIWAGINGHRKSLVLGQIMLWAAQKQKVCIASLEMKPQVSLLRMCTQAAGCRPSEEFARKFSKWSHDRIFIYDQLDTVKADRLLGMIHYAANELKCKHIVIDSLMKCGFSVDDYSGQKGFVDKLCWAAKRYGCHIHLVAHTRKNEGSIERKPGKFDVAGGADLVNMVDNCVIVWADKESDTARRKKKAGQPLTGKEEESFKRHNQKLMVCKQRDSEFEGDLNFWFDGDSLQLTVDENRALPFDMSIIH